MTETHSTRYELGYWLGFLWMATLSAWLTILALGVIGLPNSVGAWLQSPLITMIVTAGVAAIVLWVMIVVAALLGWPLYGLFKVIKA